MAMIASAAVAIEDANLGMGKHLVDVHTSQRSQKLCTFIAEITYTTSITLSKTSVLCFYVRVFQVERRIYRATLCLGSLTLMWGFAFLFTSIFQCRPIHGAWTSQTREHCINILPVFVGGAASDFAIDILILVLPAPILYRLNMSTLRKLGLLITFLLGYR